MGHSRHTSGTQVDTVLPAPPFAQHDASIKSNSGIDFYASEVEGVKHVGETSPQVFLSSARVAASSAACFASNKKSMQASSETGNSSAVCLPTRVVEAPRLEEGDDIASNADGSGAFAASGNYWCPNPCYFGQIRVLRSPLLFTSPCGAPGPTTNKNVGSCYPPRPPGRIFCVIRKIGRRVASGMPTTALAYV